MANHTVLHNSSRIIVVWFLKVRNFPPYPNALSLGYAFLEMVIKGTLPINSNNNE